MGVDGKVIENHRACFELTVGPFLTVHGQGNYTHSKTALMHKLQRFCTESVVIVVYHPERDDDNVCDSQRGFDGVVEVRSGALIPPRACHL